MPVSQKDKEGLGGGGRGFLTTLLPDFVIKLERKPLDNLVITLTNTEVGGIGKPRLATRPEINMKLACNPDSLRPRIDARK